MGILDFPHAAFSINSQRHYIIIIGLKLHQMRYVAFTLQHHLHYRIE